MTASISPDDLRALADITERLNGEAFEIDAETRPAPRLYTDEGYVDGLKMPRFAPWTVREVVVGQWGDGGDFALGCGVTLVRNPQTLLFVPRFS